MPPSLSVFVPAYNAAATIRGVVERIPDDAWRIIEAVHVIDDGSSDGTADVARLLETEFPKLQLHSLHPNQGYGEAAPQGMARCLATGGDYVACLHADDQYPPEQLCKFVEHMHAQY